MKLFVVLPARDESRNIARLLGRIQDAVRPLALDPHIVLVDDGSTDQTVEAARGARFAHPVHVIRFPRNQGVGEALRTGLEAVCRQGDDEDLCFTMDADDTHDPALMGSMVDCLRSGADIVVASRFRPGGGMTGCPAGRRILSSGLSVLMRSVSPRTGITDFSTFYRGYRVDLLRRTLDGGGRRILRGRGFESYTGFLLEAARTADRIDEVPARLDYGRKRGTSKMRLLRTILGQARVAAQTWLACLSASRDAPA